MSWIAIGIAPLAVACDGSGAAEGPMTGNGDAGSDAPIAGKCAQTRVRIVDYLPDVPEAGRSAVQVPTIGVHGNDLFYILNWSTPLGSAEGPGGYLVRVAISGGNPTRMAVISGGGSQGGQGLAVTASAAIFSQAHGDDAGAGAIVSMPADGGEPSLLTLTNGLANALVADGESVYFVDGDGTKAVPLAGGVVRMLTTERPFSIAVARRTVYLADLRGMVSSVPVDGGPVTILANDTDGALYPLVCGDDLCWASGPALDAGLKRLAPGGDPIVLARGFIEPHGVVFDGKSFFISAGAFFLHRVPAAGGAPLVIESQPLITSLALDDGCLYWSSAEGIFSRALSAADVATSIEE